MTTLSHTTAKIAAWNLGAYRLLQPSRLKAQVEGLTLLDADIIALVEINPITALEYFRQKLASRGAKYHYSYRKQKNRFHIGVLYKDGITAKKPRLLEGSDLDDPKKRKAFVVDMAIGKLDFTLVVVHLKSGRGRKEQKTRDAQAKVIAKFITEQRNKSNEDIVLMGDFNMIPGQDVSNFHHLGGDDLMDFLSSWDLQDRFSHILQKGRANLLDGFAISRTNSTEYIRGSLRLFPMHWAMDMGLEKYRTSVSDHLPFVASFRIDKGR